MGTYKTQRLFFDIETAANPENLALMPDPKAPANFKDPAKIEAAIAEKKAELIETAALDPDYGKILSIGMFLTDQSREIEVLLSPRDPANILPEEAVGEDCVIEAFWDYFARCRGNVIGYNILNFDLPYLLRRSMALGVKVPLIPNLAKFRSEPVTDLMAILYNWGNDKYKGLKQVARLYGIPNDCPEIDGSKVKDLDRDQLRAYQVSDIKLIMALYDRMNGVYFAH